MKGRCNKCGIEAEILEGHLGKKHKKCGGRKSSESKKDCGRWESTEIKKEIK